MSTLSDVAMKMIYDRYAWHEKGESTWGHVAQRVAHHLCNNDEKLEDDLLEALLETRIMFGGRVLRNSGRPKGNLAQCYCLPIGDSRDEIGECYKNALILWGTGGGVWVNVSTLRPKGAAIKTAGGVSSGMVGWIEAMDGIAARIESGGQRRAASLGLCEVWHPEIREFINAKLKEELILIVIESTTDEAV